MTSANTQVRSYVTLQLDPVFVRSSVSKTIRAVRRIIEKTTDNLAPVISEMLESLLIYNLYMAVAAYDQKYPSEPSGKLGSAIHREDLLGYNPGISYSRIIVDESIAPYAMWVEEGRSAPYGLPYSNVGGKDYSKSDFTGHHYIVKSIVDVQTFIPELLAKKIRENLTKYGGIIK